MVLMGCLLAAAVAGDKVYEARLSVNTGEGESESKGQ